jgi:hypothetical protein
METWKYRYTYSLKAKQGYTFRKRKEDKWICYILTNDGMKFRNEKKCRYGLPEYTGQLRVLVELINRLSIQPVLTVSVLCGKPHYLNGMVILPLSNLRIRYIELALPFAVTDKYPVVDTTPAYRLPRDHSKIDAVTLCDSAYHHP